MRTPALLAILDGVGITDEGPTNAVTSANAPFLREIFYGGTYPHRTIGAAGRDVGLPHGQMGNSEVGHLNIGAGRIVNQELTRIDGAIEDGSFSGNGVLLTALNSAKQNSNTVHLMGLLSDGGVHSMLTHLEALIRLAAANGNTHIRIHAFMDGRDVSPTSGIDHVRHIDGFCTQMLRDHAGISLRIGSIMGRYWAMDRDNRWDRVERAWRTLVTPIEPSVTSVFPETSPVKVVQDSYDKGITDEFIEPVAFGTSGIKDGDTVIFYNFRPDRARELTRALIDPAFEDYGFKRPVTPQVAFVCMTEYDPAFTASLGATVAFPKSFPTNVLANHLAALGLTQLHIAETEKYAHVTFFLNGGIEEPNPGEQRILIPSPQVATYDLQPQMSAHEVTRALVDAIEHDAADVYIVNYANGDMVGHTGILPAAIAAIEAVDAGLRRVVDAILAKDGVALVTADHGNAEQMVDPHDNTPFTAHTLSPVPLALISKEAAEKAVALECQHPARLADIAPTLLDLMDLPIPPEFTGRSLLVR